MSSIKTRTWCFTINNYTHEDEHYVFQLAWYCRYVICGREVGESGTPHLQGYVVFENAVRISTVSEYLPRAHLEPAKGDSDQNYAYCTKEGDFFEYGNRPDTQKTKGDKNRQRYAEAVQAARENRWKDVPEDILVRSGNGLRLAVLLTAESNLEDTEEKMEWYYGASGTGKSRKAREENPDAYLKMCNKWWDGYQGQDVVIIEDFDKDHKVLVHHLKIWADRYKFPAEVKGGKTDIRPRKIIVTSNYHPEDIWTDEKDLDPILRRFHVTKFTNFK